MADKLKVYLETSFVSYLTGGETTDAVMTPRTFIENANMEVYND